MTEGIIVVDDFLPRHEYDTLRVIQAVR